VKIKEALKIVLELASNQIVGSSPEDEKKAIDIVWGFYTEMEGMEYDGYGVFTDNDEYE